MNVAAHTNFTYQPFNKKNAMKKKIIRRPAKAQKVISCTGNRIVRYTFALIVMLVTLCSCERGESYEGYSARYAEWTRPNLPYESMYAQQKACVDVLNMCEHDGILDARGVEAYHRMSTIDEYVELIEECENEECFNDVIAGTDAYERYVELVRNVD